MPKKGEVIVTDKRAAGLPEAVAGSEHPDAVGKGGVSRIAGVQHAPGAGGDPLAWLPPVQQGVDPKAQPDAIGKGGVTRQQGTVIQDATVPGTIRADVPAAEGTEVRTLLADRSVGQDEPQVFTADMVHGLGKPVGGGTVDVTRVNQALHEEQIRSGVLAGDRRAQPHEPQVIIGEAVGQSLPADQLAAFREGRVFRADQPHAHATTTAGVPARETPTVKTPTAKAKRPARGKAAPAPRNRRAPAAEIDEATGEPKE